MHHHDLCVFNRTVEIERCFEIAADRHTLQEADGLDQGVLTAVTDRVQPAPAVLRFVNGDLVPEPGKLARHAAQEVRIAVIPAGGDRMAEKHQSHARASRCVMAAAMRPSMASYRALYFRAAASSE